MSSGGSLISASAHRRVISALALALLFSATPAAAHVNVFGPKTFTTVAGAPETVTEAFTLASPCDHAPQALYTLVIKSDGIASASIRLNGAEVVRESDFNQQVSTIERPVAVDRNNTLTAKINGGTKAGSLTVSLRRHIDVTEPVFAEKTYTSTAASDTFRDSFSVNGTAGRFSLVVRNGSPAVKSASIRLNGVAVVTAQDLDAGGTVTKNVGVSAANELVVETKSGSSGSYVTVAVVRHLDDRTGPEIALAGLADGQVVSDTPLTVAGTITDRSGVEALRINGVPVAIGAAGAFSTAVPLTEGANTIAIEAVDCEGNTTRRDVRVVLEVAPKLTILLPAAGSATRELTVVVSGTASASAGIASVTANGQPMTLDGEAWSGTLPFPGSDGERQITVVATDRASRATTKAVVVTIDRTDPIITVTTDPLPNADGWLRGFAAVRFTCTDAATPVECPVGRMITTDGAGQQVSGTARDAAGNTATATLAVNVDRVPPTLSIDAIPSPARTPTVAESALTLTGKVAESGSGLRSVTCNGNAANVSDATFTCRVALQPSINRIEVVAADRAGGSVSRVVDVTLDSTPPSLHLEPAGDGSQVVRDEWVDLVGYTDDQSGVAYATVNGAAAAVANGKFVHRVMLQEGENRVSVVVADILGNARTTTAVLRRVPQVRIAISTPADLATVGAAAISVSGTITPSNVSVVVNDVPATVSGGTFTANNVPLAQGRTVVTAIATSPGGVVATSNVNIYRDSIPPRLVVYSPAAGTIVRQSPIAVSGMIDDVVVGTINGEHVSVTVNGVVAEVRNRAFLAPSVPLTAGRNALNVVATDRAGNSVAVRHELTYDASAATRLTIVSGNAQTATIGAALPAPIVVRLTSATGLPVANTPVTFTVVQNNGAVSDGVSSDRVITVNTGTNGESSVRWTLGTRAGAGNQRVTATTTGAAGVEFVASARTGVPHAIVVDSGSSQFGLVNDRLQRPLIAVVVDSGGNRLANVPVTFTVTRGGASIDGRPTASVITDSDGRAWVTPALGPEAGNDNNTFEARVDGVSPAATFMASGRVGGPAADTRISGVVVDNMNLPIAGVTLRIDETSLSARSNAQGQFTIASVPVGYVKLIVDGTTTSRPGTWPTLDFVMYTLPGVDNTLGMPIYLLPLDVQRGIQVDERKGGKLTFPELPGFSLTVAPGSALFPNGSRAGTVSATMVHHDKMPMPPAFGQQPRFIVTIQPTGVHFDPPAKLTLPNLDGFLPGEVTEMFSFDHDLGQFVSIGTGSVSADGSIIESDPGVGIIKGGWHSAGNPNPTGNTSAVNVQVNAPGSAGIGQVVEVVANGTPATGGVYFNWQVFDDPADPNDNPAAAQFVSQPSCPGQPVCTAQLRILAGGIVSVRVSYTSTATSSSTSRVVTMATPATTTSQVRKLRVSMLEIEAISFLNSHPIHRDKIGSALLMSPFQWVRPTTPAESLVQDPVAYTRSQPGSAPRKMSLSVKFKINGAPLPAAISGVTISGSGGGFTFRKENVVIPAGISSMPWMTIESEEALPATTAVYEPLTIDWKYTLPGGIEEFSARKSANPLYVLLNNPVNFVYYTSLTLGVPQGAADDIQVVNRIWSRFATLNVTTWDKRTLHYYKPGVDAFSCASASVKALLTINNASGQCGAFARLLSNALGIHGIWSKMIGVESTVADGGFIVKNVRLSPTPSVPADPIYKWRLRTSSGPGLPITPPPGVTFGDVTGEPGVAGQNEPTPGEKVFNRHFVVHPQLTSSLPLLDPSYGATYSSKTEFEAKAVDAYVGKATFAAIGGSVIATIPVRSVGGPPDIEFVDLGLIIEPADQ